MNYCVYSRRALSFLFPLLFLFLSTCMPSLSSINDCVDEWRSTLGESWRVHVADGWNTDNARYKHNKWNAELGPEGKAHQTESGITRRPCTGASGTGNVEDSEENTPRRTMESMPSRTREEPERNGRGWREHAALDCGGGRTAESEVRCGSNFEGGRLHF